MRKFKFNSKPFCNDWHFFLLAGILLFVSICHPIFYSFLILYIIFLFRKTKYGGITLLLLILLFSSYCFATYQMKPMESGIYEGVFEVVDSISGGVILKGEKRIIVRDGEKKLKPGDIIEARIKISNLEQASYLGDFDAKTFYAAKQITNRGRIESYSVVNTKWTIQRLRASTLDFYQQHLGAKSFHYAKTLIFGMNEIDKEVKEAYSLFYLTHLLTISGLHIQLIFHFLVRMFQKVFKINGEHLAVVIIGIYVLFIGFPVSCLRAFLFLLIRILNQKGRIQYTRLDILSMSFLVIIFLNPYQAFQSGFILSFIISFVLLFMKDFNLIQNKGGKAFTQTILCIFSILPFIINQTNSISLLGIFFSFILGSILGKYLLPIVFLMVCVPLPYFEGVFQILDTALIYLSKLSKPISVPSLSFIGIVIYYFLFIYVLVSLARKRRRYSFIYVFFYLMLIIFFRRANIFYRVTFIDVGQGDSILIELPYDKGNILVDSYGQNDLYLKSIGIRKLDYVILTHFDYDHIGSIETILQEFQVDHILYSAYEDAGKIKNLQVPKQAIQAGNSVQISETILRVLGPIHSYSDSNSNSVVLSFDINGYTFLLTGDMTVQEEMDLIERYGSSLKADVLKVGHHGSKSSSSMEFLECVSPKYSIISVGENNSYGLPSSEVYERLKKISKVYMTKENGNICFNILNKLNIKPYRSISGKQNIF